MTKACHISDLDAMVLAGMFARTNIGCEMPDENDVRHAKAMRHPSVENSVSTFVRGIAESEEMLAMFVEEGESWYRQLKKMSRAKIEKTWPEHAKLVWGGKSDD